MHKLIKKSDILLIIVLIACGLPASIHISRTSAGDAARVHITVKGELFGTYDLTRNRTVDLGTGNIVSIKDGCVYMKKSDCSGQDCVKEGKISEPHRTIVCLPHKVMIEIDGDENEYDTVSQ